MRGLKLKAVSEADFLPVQPENPLREYFSGFPSPAEDFREGGLDLNRLLVSHPSATFFARVAGDEFHEDCIDEDDLLIINRSVKPYHGCMAVCVVNEEFTLRKVRKKGDVVTLCSSNFSLYDDMSRRVMNILKEISPVTEVYSIDEAFMDFSGIPADMLRKLGHRIVKQVKQYTGIPVSIGIAPTKTLAKVANKVCKKSPDMEGCCVLYREPDIEKVLKPFRSGDQNRLGFYPTAGCVCTQPDGRDRIKNLGRAAGQPLYQNGAYSAPETANMHFQILCRGYIRV